MYPSPCRHTASNLVYLSLLLVWSGLAAVGQTLFQIVLATDYSDELEPCECTVLPFVCPLYMYMYMYVHVDTM